LWPECNGKLLGERLLPRGPPASDRLRTIPWPLATRATEGAVKFEPRACSVPSLADKVKVVVVGENSFDSPCPFQAQCLPRLKQIIWVLAPVKLVQGVMRWKSRGTARDSSFHHRAVGRSWKGGPVPGRPPPPEAPVIPRAGVRVQCRVRACPRAKNASPKPECGLKLSASLLSVKVATTSQRLERRLSRCPLPSAYRRRRAQLHRCEGSFRK